MPDTTFEKKFARLAEDVVRKNAPALFPFYAGFQAFDQDDDASRAAGALVFTIQDSWMAVPVLYIDNGVKGHQILYSKDLDLCVPTKDGWVNVFREKGVAPFMDLRSKKARAKEERHAVGPSEVSLEGSLFPYAMKTASDDWANGNGIVDPAVLRAMLGRVGPVSRDDLLTKVAADPGIAEAFAHNLVENPDFANAVFRFYSPNQLVQVYDAISKFAADDVVEEDKPPKGRNVKFITEFDDPNAIALKPKEKKAFAKQGVFIIDERTNTSKLFQPTPASAIGYTTPSQPGFYNVLRADGGTEPCAVLHVESDRNGTRLTQKLHMVWLKNPEYVRIVPYETVLAASREQTPTESDTKRIGFACSRASLQTILDKVNEGRSPKEVGYAWANALGYAGPSDFAQFNIKKNPGQEVVICPTDSYSKTSAGLESYRGPLEFAKGPGLKVRDNTLFCDDSARLFLEFNDYAQTGPTKWFPMGSLNTIQASIRKEAGLKPVRFGSGDGSGLVVETTSGDVHYPDKMSALRGLTLGYGIEGSHASSLYKQAKENPKERFEFLIKFAAGYNGSTSLEEDRPSVTQVQTVERETRVSGPKLMPTDAVKTLTKLSEKGDKELFDLETFRSLLTSADPMKIREELTGKIAQAMDSAARNLLLLYWYPEEFEEWFGKEELPDLEDSLLKDFQINGDVVLYLQNRRAFGPEESTSMLGMLSDGVSTDTVGDDAK